MAKQMCQSCGQPLKDEIKGTQADGSPSQLYCNFCYENGAFKDPNITLAQMQVICVEAMQKMHFPKFVAKYIAKSQVPKLKRWQKQAL